MDIAVTGSTGLIGTALVRDLRALIALRADFPDAAHQAWIVERAREDLFITIRFRKGIVRPFKSPAYFDIVVVLRVCGRE